jgi:signal transduction histidine kinase
VLSRTEVEFNRVTPMLPPGMRERVRIVDALGRPLYTGGLLAEVPFSPSPHLRRQVIQRDQYTLLTTPIMQEHTLIGYIEIADLERVQVRDLPTRVLLYLLVSIGISALTFGVGLFFARRSLKPAEQMVSRLEQFTQDASHELRTPLATLNSSLDVALKTGKLQEGLLSAKDDVKQISTIVERLLELARLDTFLLQKETIDLSLLLSAAIPPYEAIAAKRQVRIEQEIAPGIRVHGDPALLRQVVANLLSNASKFNKEGGTIRVVLVSNTLRIEDTGIGIAKEALPYIFDRFYQAESSRSKEGFGLGLALVKRIVDLHGWSIHVRSTEGQGTTCVVEFSPQK